MAPVQRILTTADFWAFSRIQVIVAALSAAANQPLDLKVVRYQKASGMKVSPQIWTAVETATNPDGFAKLRPSLGSAGVVSTRPEVSNDPATTLGDGKIGATYGAVMPNGVRDGCYKIDLGAAKPITAVNAWAHNQNGNRGRQMVTVYGSNSAADPGWDLADRAKFTPIGSVDTGAVQQAFSAISLRAAKGQSLGSFRWLVLQADPISDIAENTSFQEIRVESHP